MGFTSLTEIQQKAIPLMQQGKDVIAKAPTGTGKTCAFGVPIIERINCDEAYPQVVILAPTRELAMGIFICPLVPHCGICTTARK